MTARACAVEQNLPCALNVRNPTDPFPQLGLFLDTSCGGGAHMNIIAHWGAQDFDAIGFHTSGPRSSMLGGRAPALFHVLVFPDGVGSQPEPGVSLPRGGRSHEFCEGAKARTYHPGKRTNVRQAPNFSLTSANALWIAKLKRRGMRGSPCSHPSCCWMSCRTPSLSTHL